MWKIYFNPINISISLDTGVNSPTKNQVLDYSNNLSHLEKTYIKKCLYSLKQPWISTNEKMIKFESLSDIGNISILIVKE